MTTSKQKKPCPVCGEDTWGPADEECADCGAEFATLEYVPVVPEEDDVAELEERIEDELAEVPTSTPRPRTPASGRTGSGYGGEDTGEAQPKRRAPVTPGTGTGTATGTGTGPRMRRVLPHARFEVLGDLSVLQRSGREAEDVQTVTMASDLLTLGRRDLRKKVYPDVDLTAYFSTEEPVPSGRTAAVSRKHLEILRESRDDGWRYVLRNLTAAGGTWKHGSAFLMDQDERLVLADGDVFFVGDEDFSVGFRCHLDLDG